MGLTLSSLPTRADEQPVILSRCFPSKQTAGYLTLHDRRVLSLNGECVINLEQLYQRVWQLHEREEFLRFELQCTGGNAAIVIDTSTAATVGDSILATYRIPADASPNLRRAQAESIESAN